VSRALSLLPFPRALRIPSRSVAQPSRAHRTIALRGHCRRASDARVDAQRVGPHREHRRAVLISPLVSGSAIFAHELQHPPNRVHALRRAPRANLRARARIAPLGGRLWHRAEGLPQHCVSPDKGQPAQRHVFACTLHALCDCGVQLRLELGIAEADKDSWPHELERQHLRQRPFVVKEVVRHFDFSLFAKSTGDHSGPFMGRLDEARDRGVSECVSHLFEYIVLGDQQDDAGLVRGPEVFPAAERSVLGLGDELLEDSRNSGKRASGSVSTPCQWLGSGNLCFARSLGRSVGTGHRLRAANFLGRRLLHQACER